MASSRPLDIDFTVVSAKHLKNVNWKHGELKPYAIFWVDPDRRLATKPDESGSTCPVWNERFTVSVNLPLHDSVLTLEVFHSKPSETPKPLVGSLQVPLKDLVDSDDSNRIKTFQLRRPSGRPQGKIRVKLAIRERPSPPAPDYYLTPPVSFYYSSAPPPPAPNPGGYSHLSHTIPLPPPVPQSPSPHPYGTFCNPYPGYYGYYSRAPPPPRPFFDWSANYGGPSAPVDHSPYDQKQMGVKYEEAKIKDRAESELGARDYYKDHRFDYQ